MSKTISKLTKLLSNCILGSICDKIKRVVNVTQHHTLGGLNMVNLEKFMNLDSKGHQGRSLMVAFV